MAWNSQSHITSIRPILQPSNPIRGSNTAPSNAPTNIAKTTAPILRVQFDDKIAAAQKKANPTTETTIPKKGLIFAGVLIFAMIFVAARFGRSD